MRFEDEVATILKNNLSSKKVLISNGKEITMATQGLSENEIRIRIVPQRLRWYESGTSMAWTRAHACASAFDDLIRKVDVACLEAEQDRELSATAIGRRRAEL